MRLRNAHCVFLCAHIHTCPKRHMWMGGGQAGPPPRLPHPSGASTTPSTLLLSPIHSMLSAGVLGLGPSSIPTGTQHATAWVPCIGCVHCHRSHPTTILLSVWCDPLPEHGSGAISHPVAVGIAEPRFTTACMTAGVVVMWVWSWSPSWTVWFARPANGHPAGTPHYFK